MAQLGESRVLQLFMPMLDEHNRSVIQVASAHGQEPVLEVGPGDDCAVLTGDNRRTVITTDTLVHGQDFLDIWPAGPRSGGYEVGWKATTQNLADIAAMGAEPVSLFVSLSLPPETPYGWVEDFARGILDSLHACGATVCTVGGGDLGSARDASVTITAVGRCENPVLRSGAQPGDTVALAGCTGWADAGLRLLTTTGSIDSIEQLPSTQKERIERAVTHQLRPVSPIPAGRRAAAYGANAMLDLSDGLVKDARRIAEASGVDIVFNDPAITELARELVPVASLILEHQPHNDHGDSAVSLARECVLGGGEDHGLLACFPAGATIPEGFVALGSCSAQERSASRILCDGYELQNYGWEHYRA
ncbi:thiamine-phosphate kinase [Rothia dentocariosa]|uniref:thiamine-phosphate kinase n=1 Tax=Rothia dentocariosa TaxID=2047 RepID=UPI003C7870E8